MADMDQQLRALTFLPEDWSSDPITGGSKMSGTPAPEDLTFLYDLHGHPHMTRPPPNTHAKSFKKKRQTFK